MQIERNLGALISHVFLASLLETICWVNPPTLGQFLLISLLSGRGAGSHSGTFSNLAPQFPEKLISLSLPFWTPRNPRGAKLKVSHREKQYLAHCDFLFARREVESNGIQSCLFRQPWTCTWLMWNNWRAFSKTLPGGYFVNSISLCCAVYSGYLDVMLVRKLPDKKNLEEGSLFWLPVSVHVQPAPSPWAWGEADIMVKGHCGGELSAQGSLEAESNRKGARNKL